MAYYLAADTAPPAATKWTLKEVLRRRWWLALGIAVGIDLLVLELFEYALEAEANKTSSLFQRNVEFNAEVHVVFTVVLFVITVPLMRLYLNSRLGRRVGVVSETIVYSRAAGTTWDVIRAVSRWILPTLALISTLVVLWRLFGLDSIVEAMLGTFDMEASTYELLIPDFLLLFAAFVAIVTGFASRRSAMPMRGLMKASIIISIIAAIVSITRVGDVFGFMSVGVADMIMTGR